MKHGFTQRQSNDIVDFIKNAATDLSQLRQPKSVLEQCQKIFGPCHKWMSEKVSFTAGKTFGFDKEEWDVNIDYRPLRDVLYELIRESATKSNFNFRYVAQGYGKVLEAFHAQRFMLNEKKLLGENPKDRDFVGQIIEFIDESHLDNCGRLKACPVVITLANFNCDIFLVIMLKKMYFTCPS